MLLYSNTNFKMLFKIVVLLTLVNYSIAEFKSAAVEFSPNIDETDPQKRLSINADHYVQKIEEARDLASIIVFPEYGLTGKISNAKDFAVEIEEVDETPSNEILKKISNAASTNAIYVLINIVEKSGDNETDLYYNTNIVFDKNGKILAKYRKINLFNEPDLTPGTSVCTFRIEELQTSFGLFTSHDILYPNPSNAIFTERPAISTILFPTAWASTKPYYLALSTQYAYARSFGVNVISSSYNDPANGFSGSSIISADGEFQGTFFGGVKGTTIISGVIKRTDKVDSCKSNPFGVQGLPTDKYPNKLEDLKLTSTFMANQYTFKKFNFATKTNANISACDGEFCCNVNVDMQTIIDTEVYQVLAYKGKAEIDGVSKHVKYCALVSCTSEDTSSCGEPSEEGFSTTFKTVTITATFENKTINSPLPITLSHKKLLPLKSVYFCKDEGTDDQITTKLTVEKPSDVLIVGITSVDAGAAGVSLSIGLLIVASFLANFIFKY